MRDPTVANHALEERLGHRFSDRALLTRALTHRSAAGKALDSNERLEFLGDRVLGLCIAEWLAARFPQEREGDLGKRLATLCSQEVIAPIAERMGHEAVDITYRYAHLFPTKQDEMAAALDGARG